MHISDKASDCAQRAYICFVFKAIAWPLTHTFDTGTIHTIFSSVLIFSCIIRIKLQVFNICTPVNAYVYSTPN